MVSANFVRVFGDNRGHLEGCVHCLSSAELTGTTDENEYLSSLSRVRSQAPLPPQTE
ncbi:DUF7563 family protein [Natronococcus zhouii]